VFGFGFGFGFGGLWLRWGGMDGGRGDVLVLNNFVASLGGASALDEGVAAAEDGDGVFADVAEPDVS